MRVPTSSELLDLWDLGQRQPSGRRALALLELSCDDEPHHQLAALSVGERDRRLLQLRELLFGRDLEARSACPSCGETVQMTFPVQRLCAPTPQPVGRSLRCSADEYAVEFRLPTAADMAEAPADPSPDTLRTWLIERTVTAATRSGNTVPATALPAQLVEQISERMTEADPQAELILALDCPYCRSCWTSPFDIVGYLWAELQAWGTRLIRQIHELARAYGWSQPQILALSDWRRRAYIELIRA